MSGIRRFEPELTRPEDLYFNYCWWPYQPVAAVEDKLRPVNLLFHSFDCARMTQNAYQVVDLIRTEIGPFRTVWGVKWVEGRLAWEYYFYDYNRRERQISITRVLNTIRPVVSSRLTVNENLPYFMFSLDINAEVVTGERPLHEVHMYVGNPGSTVSSGIAYSLRQEATILENLYFFFDAKRNRNDAAAKIFCSAYVDASKVPIDSLLWPELRDCHTICVANKRANDTVYFSGVNVDQLLYFLKRLNYPKAIIGDVLDHRSMLDHLLFDVGFDYIAQGDEVKVVKSGYYGVF